MAERTVSTDHLVHHHRGLQDGKARAAVFGVSDGLVSNVALIIGVAAADAGASAVLVAGVAGLLAGAASMAAGEYVSVKAQSELIERELERERISIRDTPHFELRELTTIYELRGIDPEKAAHMAEAVMADPEIALEVHAREELGIDPNETGQPFSAALSSFVAFSVGAIVPLIPWLFGGGTVALVSSIILGLVAAGAVGWAIAYFTEKSKSRTIARQILLGSAACLLTWLAGSMLGETLV